MSFLDHLKKQSKQVFWSLFGIAIVIVPCSYFSPHTINLRILMFMIIGIFIAWPFRALCAYKQWTSEYDV